MSDWLDCLTVGPDGEEVRVEGVGYRGGGQPLPHYGYPPDPGPPWEQFPDLFGVIEVRCATCGAQFEATQLRGIDGEPSPGPWRRWCDACTQEWRAEHNGD